MAMCRLSAPSCVGGLVSQRAEHSRSHLGDDMINRVRMVRMRLGLSQAELAARLDVSVDTYGYSTRVDARLRRRSWRRSKP
jgi:hypothetical protein